MKNFIRFILPAALIVTAACDRVEKEPDIQDTVYTTLEVGLPGAITRTHLGDSEGGTRKVYWSNGDKVALNGVESAALSGIGDNATSATFTFPGVISAPFSLLYPSSFYTDAGFITLPGIQSADAFAAPLVGYATDASGISLGHLCSIIQLSVKKDPSVSASNLATVKFKGKDNEQVCGLFNIDYSVPDLTSAGTGNEVTLTVGKALSETTALDLFIVVPAREYEHGFTVELEDASGRTMTKIKSSGTELKAGKLVKFTEFTFKPSPETTEFTIDDVTDEVLPPDGYNITGRVVDNDGKGLENVVVSDGHQCVRTMFDGSFYMESTLADVKFVFVSTPSGYLPVVTGGIPHFYKAKADISPAGGIYDFGDFVLTPVANPDRFTLLITADPQPRKYENWNNDRVAFKSLDVCEDMYDELAEVAAGISGRQVYGICLGDIVHETMDLFSNYNTGLARLGFPTYNVIGNHDNDPSATTDDGGAAPFESYYGPRNYSFNIGGIHFVVLDNLIMKQNPDNGNKLTSFDQGLTDSIWEWLQADLSFIPVSSKLMVFAHSPMFKLPSGNERSNTASHGSDYGDLINDYAEVHAWAGHTHVGFNYNYPSNHRHKRIQVHTLARSTGELWTNEYLASGTPRGFTVVEVDNGDISWKFHPITRQRGAFMGITSGICSAGAPAYNWRDWNYNSSKVAVMKDGSGTLSENYQLHAYPRGSYGDNYVYANVFLWDDKWSLPVWTPTGGTPVEMTLVHDAAGTYITDTEKIYDLANTEIKSHYKPNVGFFKNDDGYPASEIGEITTLFRAPANATPSSGTVSVTDRFGNIYTRTVSW
jgi:hypothetical protein